MMRKSMLALIVIGAIAAPAAATDPGFYVGAGIGITSLDVRDFNPDFADLRFEEQSFGFKVFGGYRILKYLAVEAGYTDFGNVRSWEGGNLQFFKEANVDVSVWSGYVVGLVPASDKVDFFAKIGYGSWNLDNTTTADGVTEDLSRTGSDLAFGLGMNFRIKKFGIRVEGDWLEVEDTDGVFLFSGSLTYNF